MRPRLRLQLTTTPARWRFAARYEPSPKWMNMGMRGWQGKMRVPKRGCGSPSRTYWAGTGRVNKTERRCCSELQSVKPQPIRRSGCNHVHWRSCRYIRNQKGGKALREVGSEFDREKLTGRAAPTEVDVPRLRARLDIQGQADPRPEAREIGRASCRER